MSCLFCKNFHAVEPPEHRREREAHACRYSCGDRWDAYTTARYVKHHKRDVDGVCLFNPVPAKVSAHWMCAKFEDGFYETWHIGQPGERQNIWDWAHTTMRTFIDGDYTTQEINNLRKENEQLKHAVKAARQRSAGRLARLSKLAKKKEPAKPPVPLRLVAAE